MVSSSLHANLQIVEWLVGKWVSFEVKGQYSTVKDFSYQETLEFQSIGQPLLNYSSLAQNYSTGAPMHLERGFLRVNPDTNQVALIVSQNSGICTIEEGTVEYESLVLETQSIGRTSFAKHPFVTKYQRKYWLEKDVLYYEQQMETENTPLMKHLTVKYRKHT